MKFLKQVLVEQGELDRLRERQIRDYSPEIRSMVKIQDDIHQILLRTDLSPQQKLDMLSVPQARFDHLKAETNTLQGQTASASPEVPKPAEKKVVEKKATEKKATEKKVAEKPKEKVDGDEADEEDNVDTQEEEEEVNKTPVKSFIISPLRMGVSEQYRQKAEDLMEKIVKRPDIITRNDGGELVYMGQAVPNSDFNGLFVGMFTSGSVVRGAGSTELFQALRQLGVQSGEMTSGKYRDAYGRTPQPTRRPRPPTIDLDDEPDLDRESRRFRYGYRKSIGESDESFRSPMINPSRQVAAQCREETVRQVDSIEETGWQRTNSPTRDSPDHSLCLLTYSHFHSLCTILYCSFRSKIIVRAFIGTSLTGATLRVAMRDKLRECSDSLRHLCRVLVRTLKDFNYRFKGARA